MKQIDLEAEVGAVQEAVRRIMPINPSPKALRTILNKRYRDRPDVTPAVLKAMFEGVGHDSRAWRGLAGTLLINDRNPALVDYWVSYMREAPDSDRFLKRDALYALARIDTPEALTAMKLLHADPSTSEELQLLGSLYLGCMDTAGAKEELLKRVGDNPLELAKTMWEYKVDDWEFDTLIEAILILQRCDDFYVKKYSGFVVEHNAQQGSENRQKLRARLKEADVEMKGVWERSDCFIATAASGSADSIEVVILQTFRDRHLRSWRTERILIVSYEVLSPPLAAIIAKISLMRVLTLWLLVRPATHLAALCLRRLERSGPSRNLSTAHSGQVEGPVRTKWKGRFGASGRGSERSDAGVDLRGRSRIG